jgi:LmbE family N-acetylglucosaminyl deacetylase
MISFRTGACIGVAAAAVLLAATLGARPLSSPSKVGSAPLSDQRGGPGLLPQDTGKAGLEQMLLRLNTTARLMHTTAHPDDEDGGMLTFESRGQGAAALLFTLNRGEGGQNRVGSNLFDELGILRTLELLASDKYYGVEQRFSHVVDFGFSKTPEETFEKWQGHDTALADMVRVIRSFRPDVLVSRFQGAARDGHGNHEAAGILSREAFRAAADPKRFPEQVAEGLLPWQAKKLYVDNVRDTEDYTIDLNTGANAPALGVSYVHFAMEGLRHQLSQGAGAWNIEPGDHHTYYKLVDSVMPPLPPGKREQNFFDGLDTSVPALADRLGGEQGSAAFLKPALLEFSKDVSKASAEAGKDPNRAAAPLLSALNIMDALLEQVRISPLSEAAKLDLETALQEKQQQCAAAVNMALGIALDATVTAPGASANSVPQQQDALTVVAPGQWFTVIAKLHNGSKDTIRVADIGVDGSGEWVKKTYKSDAILLKPGEDYYANFRMRVPEDAAYTRPYFQRDSPEQAIYRLTEPRYATRPFPPPPLHVRASYVVAREKNGVTFRLWQRPMQAGGQGKPEPGSRIVVPVRVPYLDEKRTAHDPMLAVGPDFSVALDPVAQVLRADAGSAVHVKVSVRSDVSGNTAGTVQLRVPSGWRVQPQAQPANFTHRGEQREFAFALTPAELHEGREQVQAVFSSGGREYKEGFTAVTREDLGTFYYYQPAVQHLSAVNVRIPPGLKVGYIMGAGDDIPVVLQQLGMDVTLVSPQELAQGDLARYGTIVAGIRAYDARDDLKANNRRLLEYVSQGGTLIVQYNQQWNEFNAGNYLPYPAHESRDRVTVEQAPVGILAPQDSVFRYPNPITAQDFDGWVQERGLYFMDTWDNHYQPLLSSADPNEPERKGGLLRAQYGKGTYIYAAYAFFRQLPEGVPGAIRLFVNLISAGHETAMPK